MTPQTVVPVPRLLTIAQVADLLQIGRNGVYHLINTGQLRRLKLGKSARISREEIERFLASLHEAEGG